LKHRNRKSRGNKTNYRKVVIMAVLFGALLIGGSITAFSNFGGQNKFKDLIINDLPKDKLSTLSAEASYCAAEQNKFWDYHDEVYRNSRGENTGWISNESLLGFANNVNMPNIAQFTECLNSHKYNQLVMQNDIFAKNLGLSTTPTFLILKDNSTKIAAVEGAQPISVFDDVIAQFLNNTL
jgi:protein-disulfide isomerase